MLTLIAICIYLVLTSVYTVHAIKLLHQKHISKTQKITKIEYNALRNRFLLITLIYCLFFYFFILLHLSAQSFIFYSTPYFPPLLIYTLAVLGILPFLFLIGIGFSYFLYWLLFHARRHATEMKSNIQLHNATLKTQSLESKRQIETKITEQQATQALIIDQQITNAKQQKALEIKHKLLEQHLPKKETLFETIESWKNLKTKTNPKKGKK